MREIHGLRRRAAIIVAAVAALAAAGAVAAVSGSGPSMHPAGSVATTGGAAVSAPDPDGGRDSLAHAHATATSRATPTADPGSDRAAPIPPATRTPGVGPTPPPRHPQPDPTSRPGPCAAAGPNAAPGPCPPPPQPCNAASTAPPPGATPAMWIHPCGPPCPPPPAAAQSETTPPAPAMAPYCPATVLLTEADGGRTVTVRAGTRILVRLSGHQTTMWSAPRSSDEQVVTTVSSGRSSTGDAVGDFRAAGGGHAELTAGGGANCTGTRPCPMYMRIWIVHIVVVS